MNVLLCDDDEVFLNNLKRKLSVINCNIYSYTTVFDVLNSNLIFDIAFIDIELGENETGFKIVRFLKNSNKKCVIAFFTNYNQYAIKGYEYQPFRYILKTEPEALINRRIKEIFTEYKRRQKIISGTYNGYSFRTSLDDIFYISIFNHVVTLHTSKGDFELYRQMKDLCDELGEFGFFRCHRSYMINLRHVYIMRSDSVFVLDDKNHTVIPVGIRYKDAAKEHYLRDVLVGE